MTYEQIAIATLIAADASTLYILWEVRKERDKLQELLTKREQSK
jgi:hypothetical protein